MTLQQYSEFKAAQAAKKITNQANQANQARRPYYEKYPQRCPNMLAHMRQGNFVLEPQDLARLTEDELCCVLIYSVRGAKRHTKNQR